MKKIALAAAALAAVTALALTGCSGSGRTTDPSASGDAGASGGFAADATIVSRQDIVCQGGATRTAIAVPIAVRDLVSLTVTATSADSEGVWTAQLQR